jgi:tetratricopeptide (TPR) repeat protein
LARAWRLLAQTYNNAGRFAEASEAADKIVHYASAAGEPRLAARAATTKAYALLLGAVRTEEAIRQCEELILQVGGDRRAEAIVSGTLSVLHAMRGSFDRARELYTEQRQILEGLGRNVAAMTTSINSARVELLAGDPEAAEREARRDFDALGELGETYFRSTVAGMLARALYEGGRFGDAESIAEEARALTAEDDFESQVLWRGVAARLHARDGRADEALELADSQLKLAAETASPVFESEARVERAEVLVLLGRQEEAEPPLREALRLSEEKGDLVSADRIRLLLEAAVPA